MSVQRIEKWACRSGGMPAWIVDALRVVRWHNWGAYFQGNTAWREGLVPLYSTAIANAQGENIKWTWEGKVRALGAHMAQLYGRDAVAILLADNEPTIPPDAGSGYHNRPRAAAARLVTLANILRQELPNAKLVAGNWLCSDISPIPGTAYTGQNPDAGPDYWTPYMDLIMESNVADMVIGLGFHYYWRELWMSDIAAGSRFLTVCQAVYDFSAEYDLPVYWTEVGTELRQEYEWDEIEAGLVKIMQIVALGAEQTVAFCWCGWYGQTRLVTNGQLSPFGRMYRDILMPERVPEEPPPPPPPPEPEDDSEFVQYEHHGRYVWVRSALKGKHREHTLCYDCERFRPNSQGNCPRAELLHQLGILTGMTTPVWECPIFWEAKSA